MLIQVGHLQLPLPHQDPKVELQEVYYQLESQELQFLFQYSSD